MACWFSGLCVALLILVYVPSSTPTAIWVSFQCTAQVRKPALLQATDFTFSGLRDLQSWLIGPQFGFWGVGVQASSSSYLTKMFVEGLLSEWSFVLLPNYDVGQWFESPVSCGWRLLLCVAVGN